MCGIAGFINKQENLYQNKLKKMCDQIIHRGPDAFGYWYEPDVGVALGHRRLSILDLSENGTQPMISASGRLTIAFNGEIYNFKEIKEKILQTNDQILFKSKTDTEILLEAFELFGIDATLEIVRGMFAIALYDARDQALYLVRDRMGEKPLYYGFHENHLVFGSSLDSIAAYTGELEINPHALLQFICYGYIPGALSIYNEIYKVLPGQYIKIDCRHNALAEKKLFWNIEKISQRERINLDTTSEEELTNQFEALLTEVIREQVVADVPVGAYLSGGVDSSLVVALMQQVKSDVRTYTIGIEDGGDSDEAPWAQQVADSLGVKHTTEYITKDNMLDAMLKMGKTFCEPFADISQVPTYMVSKLARKDVTVTLSGDGGDELFCGYTHHIKYPSIWQARCTSRKYNAINSAIASMVLALPRNRYTDRMMDFKTKYHATSLEGMYRAINESQAVGNRVIKGAHLNEMRNDDVPLQRYSNRNGLNDYDNLMLIDQLQYLPDDILTKVDRTGMAVSLENRIPLLDKQIVEFAWSLPIELKYDGFSTKKIMRNVLYKYVPRELIERPKQGFSFPALGWLMQSEKQGQYVKELFETRISGNNILNKTIVLQVWHEFLNKGIGSHLIWNLVMLLIWADERDIYL